MRPEYVIVHDTEAPTIGLGQYGFDFFETMAVNTAWASEEPDSNNIHVTLVFDCGHQLEVSLNLNQMQDIGLSDWLVSVMTDPAKNLGPPENEKEEAQYALLKDFLQDIQFTLH